MTTCPLLEDFAVEGVQMRVVYAVEAGNKFLSRSLFVPDIPLAYRAFLSRAP